MGVRLAPEYAGCSTWSGIRNSWNHCFFNHKDNLEIHQVGEVRENDILNIQWARQLYASCVRELEYELKQAKERIQNLECELDNLNSQQGKYPAANDIPK